MLCDGSGASVLILDSNEENVCEYVDDVDNRGTRDLADGDVHFIARYLAGKEPLLTCSSETGNCHG